MIIRADSVEVSNDGAEFTHRVKVVFVNPDLSDLTRDEYKKLLNDLDPGEVLDIIGKDVAKEYFDLKEDE